MGILGISGISVVEGQRRAVERLKSSLFGADPYVRSKYIQDFHREFQSFRAKIRLEELLETCLRARIVFVGDYHALPSCQSFAADLVEYLASRTRSLILFLEMVFTRDQHVLDRYLAGDIDARALRRGIRYERDWGYPWEGYGRLLASAKAAGVPVVAADAPPRGGLRLIRRRDRHAALMVREWLQALPEAKALVLFGESHVASGHLPRDVKRELAHHGLARSSIVIVQNVESIYWKLARAGDVRTDAVMIDTNRFAVMNASPLAKYEAYRQTLLRWSQQEEEAPDFMPSIHHLIDLLGSYLGLDPYRTMVPSPRGGVLPLVDLYPEVLTRQERRRSDPAPARFPRRPGPRQGIVYRRGSNRIDVHSFSIAAAGEAAARFLLAALGGNAGRPLRGREPLVQGRSRRRAGTAGAGGWTRTPGIARRVLEEAFVGFAIQCLGAGAAPQEVRKRPRRVKNPRRSERRLSDRPEWSGDLLGEGLYARLHRRGAEKQARAWLLEVARVSARPLREREATLARLVVEGSRLAGWTGPKKARGGAP